MEPELFEEVNHSLTPDQLRKYPGLEHLTDEEAWEDIETLEKLAAILLEFNSNNKNNCGESNSLQKPPK